MHYSLQYLLTILVLIMLSTYPLVGGMEISNMLPWIEITALLTLIVLFVSVKDFSFLSVGVWLFIGFALLTPLLYLIPLPFEWVKALPGREVYTQVQEWVANNDARFALDSRPLSLIPYRTEHAFYFLLPPLAIFLATAALPIAQRNVIIHGLLLIAFAEASLALIQFSTGSEYFFFGIPQLKPGIAYGTYQNPDHFSFLMAMAMALSLALLASQLSLNDQYSTRDDSTRMLLIISYGGLSILLLAGSIFSGSRAGIALTFLAAISAWFTFFRTSGKLTGIVLFPLLIIGGIVVLSSFDLTPVLNRFVGQNPLEDGRWEIFRHSLEGIVAFFPLGSGPGTFPEIYKIFQPAEQTGFINHAHNDYLEILFEIGLPGLLLMAAGFILLLKYRRAGKLRSDYSFARRAAGIGIIIFLLHSLVEFNMHDALNVLALAILMAVHFTPEPQSSSSSLLKPR